MLIPAKSATSAVARSWSVWVLWPIMLLVLFSASVESADIKIEMIDPPTGKTTSTYEKTYSPMEKEQIQEGVEQKRTAEDIPGGLAKKVELEKKRLEDILYKEQHREHRIYGGSVGGGGGGSITPWTKMPDHSHDNDAARAIEQQIEELKRDPELYFYKQSQSTKSGSTRQHGVATDPKTGNVVGTY